MTASVFQSKLFSYFDKYKTKGLFLENDSVLDPEYVSGFVAADGTFFISRPAVGSKWPNYDAIFA